MLPSEYRHIIAMGVVALEWVEAGLRAGVAQRPAAANLWLDIRDAGSLAGRIAGEDDWAWQTGFAGIMSSPQDLGVLDAFARQCEELSPYQGDAQALAHADHLRSLRAFLTRYQARDFDFEDPNTYPNAAGSGTAG